MANMLVNASLQPAGLSVPFAVLALTFTPCNWNPVGTRRLRAAVASTVQEGCTYLKRRFITPALAGHCRKPVDPCPKALVEYVTGEKSTFRAKTLE